MHGGGYVWKTESERESAKKNMTASARKRYSARRQKNESARRKRWGNLKKVAAVAAVAGLGYGAFKHYQPKSEHEPVYNVKKMPDSYTISYPNRKNFVSRMYSADEGYERVKQLTGEYSQPYIYDTNYVIYKKSDSNGTCDLRVDTIMNNIRLTWTPSQSWVSRLRGRNPSMDMYEDVPMPKQDMTKPFSRSFHIQGDYATLENDFLLNFTPNYVHKIGGGYFWKTSERESKRKISARKRRWGRFKKLAAATAIAGLGYGAYKQFKPEDRGKNDLSSHVVAAPKPQFSYDNIKCLIDKQGDAEGLADDAVLGKSISGECPRKI